jgi:hypothetical protein
MTESEEAQQARAALQALIARLSDADAIALWKLILSWYPVPHEEADTP